MTEHDSNPDDKQPVEITWADLESPDVSARVEDMRAARQVPLVRTVGEAPPTPSGLAAVLRGSVLTMTLAGLVGGVVAWALVEFVLRPDAESNWYGDSPRVGSILASLAIGLGIGLVIAAWDGIQARSVEKTIRSVGLAAVALVGLGLVGGYIASLIYSAMTDTVAQEGYARAMAVSDPAQAEQVFWDYVNSHLHLPRGIAIGFVGLTVGAGLGLSTLSGRRALNGAVGGVIGGFVGGFLFDYIAGDSGLMPRLVAIVLTGVLIGLLTGLVEVARRDHWLEIVSGGLAGKQFIVYHVDSVIGSAGDVAITLIKDAQIAPRHATLRRTGGELTIGVIDPAYPVLVNGVPITSHRLHDSDLIQLGSSIVRYRAKESAAPVSGQIHGSS